MVFPPPEKTGKSQCFIVLGMHRSGTSTLLRTLLEVWLRVLPDAQYFDIRTTYNQRQFDFKCARECAH